MKIKMRAEIGPNLYGELTSVGRYLEIVSIGNDGAEHRHLVTADQMDAQPYLRDMQEQLRRIVIQRDGFERMRDVFGDYHRLS